MQAGVARDMDTMLGVEAGPAARDFSLGPRGKPGATLDTGKGFRGAINGHWRRLGHLGSSSEAVLPYTNDPTGEAAGSLREQSTPKMLIPLISIASS